jgi:hypothetical protein
MSSMGPGRTAGDEPTRRWDGDADASRRRDGDAEPTRRSEPAAEWTRPWVAAQPPPPPGAAPTRPLPSPDGHPAEDAIGASETAAADRTQALEAPWEGTARPYPTGSHPAADEPPSADEEPTAGAAVAGRGTHRGRDVALLLVGSVLGFVLAFLVVAWSTSGDPASDDDAAVALQADNDALEEQVGALEAERDEANARSDELEAQLAEAEAAAGQRDEDVEAQRQALDERAAALDERAAALDARETQLDEREAALDDRVAALDAREQDLAEREAALDTGEVPTEGDGGGPADEGDDGGGIQLPELPEIDTDGVGNVVEGVLDWLRDLF